MLSVNQIMAQIKLVEVWKSINIKDYPIQWRRRSDFMQKVGLKAANKPDLVITGMSAIQDSTFINECGQDLEQSSMRFKRMQNFIYSKKANQNLH